MHMSRRQFLGSSAATVIAAGTLGRSTVFGANDRIRIACVGINGRGTAHIGAFSKLPDSEVVALCDVDSQVLAREVAALKDKTGKEPKAYRDMRDVMADKDIDAVSFATPNHWHTLGSIWACQAGKDVYVEKPLSHEVWEGRQLAAAAAQTGRVVMHGTQSRSSREWARAVARLKEGVIGEVYMARALCFKNRDSIGMKEPKAPPAHLDWTLWQGPAKEQAYCENYVHYNWHWFWEYGNGDLGNQGVHQMDIARWGLGVTMPVRMAGMGGRYGYHDQGETANTEICTFTYADGRLLVFEVRGRATNDEGGAKVGNLFYGSDGYMVDQKFFDKDGKLIEDDKSQEENAAAGGDHFAAFIKAVRSRKPEDNPCDALVGHYSSAHCHLGNIAYRTQMTLTFDEATETFTGAGADEANKYLRREYRPGFEVPQLA